MHFKYIILSLIFLNSNLYAQKSMVIEGFNPYANDKDTISLLQVNPIQQIKAKKWTSIIKNKRFKFELESNGAEVYRLQINKKNSVSLYLSPGRNDLIFKDSLWNEVDNNATALEYINQYFNNTELKKLEGMYRWLKASYNRELNLRIIDSATVIKREKSIDSAQSVWEQYSMKWCSEWIRRNPESIINSKVLYDQLNFMPEDTVRELFALIPDSLMKNSYGKLIKFRINHLFIGSQVPEIEQQNIERKVTKLSQYRGRFVLIDFWASWCLPCRKENPRLVEVYQKYKKSNFIIFGVSLDRSFENWKNAIKQDKLDWIQVSDLKDWNNKAVIDYMISTIPSNVLIDPNGKILERNIPINKFEEKLNYYIGEK